MIPLAKSIDEAYVGSVARYASQVPGVGGSTGGSTGGVVPQASKPGLASNSA